jgi:Matrixin
MSAYPYARTGQQWITDWNSAPCGPYSGGTWNPCTEHYYTTTAFNNQTGWNSALANAAAGWSLYDAGRNQQDFLFVNDSRISTSNAGVQVTAGDLGGRGANGVITLGTASWQYFLPPYNALYQVFITMSTDSQISWSTTGAPTSSQYDLIEASMHELGHGLGLTHPTQGPYSFAVMQCNMAAGENDRRLADDLQGQSWLYSSHRADFGTPGSSPC